MRLHAPIADPGKFICIGLNYKDHAAETGNPAPKEPPIFPKWNNTILDPGEPILRPRGEKTLDWEVELGVVIGRTARYVSKERALDYVYGYTIINDASAREFQFLTTQWSAGKIADTLAPVGPYIADRTEIPDPHVLDLKTWVNGALMQNGNTSNFIFDVRYLVSYLSGIMTLSPGDLIATGTPAGVGFSRKPRSPCNPATRSGFRSPGSGCWRIPSRTRSRSKRWRCERRGHPHAARRDLPSRPPRAPPGQRGLPRRAAPLRDGSEGVARGRIARRGRAHRRRRPHGPRPSTVER